MSDRQIVVSLIREPVTVPLTGAYAGVTVTLRRLTTPDYAEAQQAAQAIIQDESKLLPLLIEHGLLPEGKLKAWKRKKETDPISYARFLTGVAMWVGAVECGVKGIDSWTGILGEDRKPAPVHRDVIEVLMLDEHFSSQVTAELDKAARILAIEGKPSGVSPTGSSGVGTTA
ncbi:hypothetical protein [Brevundimonas sp.]|uniref:hypothetical protein n=1 Tax=Brevundimonas sp. TaxID=1871086 RepID=UPI001A1936CF|nr:hypothetical protein [Brevundimonas sp.]MBJ7485963.1 hypothetical protein [Brevundimonas sp.]